MNVKRESRRTSPLHLAILPAAVAFLLSAAPAEAGWKPPSPGTTVVAGAAAAGVGYSLRKNLGELIEQFGGVFGASIEEDDEAVYRFSAETDKFSGKLVGDSHPVLKGVSYSIDASRAAVAGFKEKLRSAQRKIGRLVGKAGETVLDARAALAINKNERRWYESESGILDTKPLPAVRVPVPSSTPVSGARRCPGSRQRRRSSIVGRERNQSGGRVCAALRGRVRDQPLHCILFALETVDGGTLGGMPNRQLLRQRVERRVERRRRAGPLGGLAPAPGDVYGVPPVLIVDLVQTVHVGSPARPWPISPLATITVRNSTVDGFVRVRTVRLGARDPVVIESQLHLALSIAPAPFPSARLAHALESTAVCMAQNCSGSRRVRRCRAD